MEWVVISQKKPEVVSTQTVLRSTHTQNLDAMACCQYLNQSAHGNERTERRKIDHENKNQAAKPLDCRGGGCVCGGG